MPMAEKTRKWTLRDLHSLPDDGNKYELIRGELFVTPAPSDAHEELLAQLTALLVPYVERERLGRVYHPRAIVRRHGSEAEPDLQVRAVPAKLPSTWDEAPLPILIVEVASPTTRRRDREHKRSFYMDLGIAEYWIVDDDERTITVARPGVPDIVCDATLDWHPHGARDPLSLDVHRLFAAALG